jgi:hypothetical protein
MNFEEGITHFLEKQVSLEDYFRNVGAITAGQIGSTSITVSGDLNTRTYRRQEFQLKYLLLIRHYLQRLIYYYYVS